MSLVGRKIPYYENSNQLFMTKVACNFPRLSISRDFPGMLFTIPTTLVHSGDTNFEKNLYFEPIKVYCVDRE